MNIPLDPNHKYIVGLVHKDPHKERALKKFQPCYIPEHERWTHITEAFYVPLIGWRVMAFFDVDEGKDELNEWHLIDAVEKAQHMGDYRIYAFPYDYLSVSELRKHIGRPFSINKLRHLAYGEALTEGFGITCSELPSLCDREEMVKWFSGSRSWSKSPMEVLPVDWQMYGIEQDLEFVEIEI